MAQWAVTIGRLDIAYAVSSLSRFNANPREGHLELAMHVFSYLKRFPNKRLLLDSRPMGKDPKLDQESFHPDFLDDYPDAREDLDPELPKSFGEELDSAIFFDADHSHDQVTRRSISGIIVMVGSTPVLVMSKRQGCIATSTYCAEFVAMRTAVEEAISIRYMLRCLGIPVTRPTNLYGDNKGSIQTANIPDAVLKKKHIAISYHYVREAVAHSLLDTLDEMEMFAKHALFLVDSFRTTDDLQLPNLRTGKTSFIAKLRQLWSQGKLRRFKTKLKTSKIRAKISFVRNHWRMTCSVAQRPSLQPTGKKTQG